MSTWGHDLGVPFEIGDRVAVEVIPILKHMARQGTLRRVERSYEDDPRFLIIAFYVQLDGDKHYTGFEHRGGQDWPIRKLDPVEAIAKLAERT